MICDLRFLIADVRYASACRRRTQEEIKRFLIYDFSLPDVRYASACRRRTQEERLHQDRILTNVNDKLKHIGHIGDF